MSTENLQLLRQGLESLGLTSKEVASKLLAQGCRGKVGCSEECPLAIFLISQLEARIVVGIDNVFIYEPGFYEVELTPATNQFIRDFDTKKYPELIVG
jgi:hypothetical protein